jgi:cation:H+ antiporter
LTEAFGVLAAGLVVLVFGANGVVRGASRIAERLGVSRLFIGLTVVALGTSSPEVVVSLEAAVRGFPSLAVGNVVGSNIFNIGVVLGMTAIISPIPIHGVIVRREVPIVIGLTALLFAIAHGGAIIRFESGFLLLGLVAYIAWAYRTARAAHFAPPGEPSMADTLSITLPGKGPPKAGASAWAANLAFLIGGLAFLVIGSRYVIDGAEGIARIADISDTLVGLSVVAVGTSLPELTTSVVAAFRKEPEMAVGNVLGSNIFNVLMILGIAGVVQPLEVSPRIVSIDIPVALGFAVACFPILMSSRRISRAEGFTLLILYGAYIVFLVR